MRKRNWIMSTVLLLLFLGIPSMSQAVTVYADFIHSNPQIFPVGDMVDVKVIDAGEDLNLGSFPDLFWVRINPDQIDPFVPETVLFEVIMVANGIVLIDYWSLPFSMADWWNYSGGDGKYTNLELDAAEQSGWIYRDPGRTITISSDTFADLLDGPNLVAGFYTVEIRIFSENYQLLTSYMATANVYNPSAPNVQTPYDNEVVYGYPVFMAWTWNGGAVSTDDINLIVVEVPEDEEYQEPREIIDNRSPANTRYEGSPQFSDYHVYTGSGEEQALVPGSKYCWMVEIGAYTVLGDMRTFPGIPGSFTFEEIGGEQDIGDGSLEDESGSGDEGGQDIVLDLLEQLLPSDILDGLMGELEGFDLHDIAIEGEGGKSVGDLINYLNTPGLEVTNASVE